MRGKSILLSASGILFLLIGSFIILNSGWAAQLELRKNQSFIKKARAIEAGDWEKVKPKEIAIAGLYELTRSVDRLESRLESELTRSVDRLESRLESELTRSVDRLENHLNSELDRFYRIARIGILVFAAYIVIQFIATLAILIKIGRRTV